MMNKRVAQRERRINNALEAKLRSKSRYAHIAPFGSGLELAKIGKRNDVNLLLAQHLAKDNGYDFGYILDCFQREVLIIDNGAFEGGALSIEEMIDVLVWLSHAADLHEPYAKVGVVAPDYPLDAERTKLSAREFCVALDEAVLSGKIHSPFAENLFVLMVPQGPLGDTRAIEDQIRAVVKDEIQADGVCLSILNAPNAVKHKNPPDAYSRTLLRACLEDDASSCKGFSDGLYVHYLGLFPEATQEPFDYPFDSCDSAAPLKLAILGINLENPPKRYAHKTAFCTIESPRFFTDDPRTIALAEINDQVIRKLLGRSGG